MARNVDVFEKVAVACGGVLFTGIPAVNAHAEREARAGRRVGGCETFLVRVGANCPLVHYDGTVSAAPQDLGHYDPSLGSFA